MGFTRFIKGSSDKGIGIQIIDESTNEDLEVADYYQGIYRVNSYTHSFFDVTFIPEFQRKTNSWYRHNLGGESEINSSQKARLITATEADFSVTPDELKAGTKEEFNILLTPEQEEYIKIDRLDPKEFTHRTIYYVTPREFSTFRGEIITIITEKDMGQLDLINLRDILDFSFIQFILNNIVNPQELKEFQEQYSINLVKI